jgi:hypothetical protein
VAKTKKEPWEKRVPDLIADVRFFRSEGGGRKSAALRGWGCPCFVSKDATVGGWDARLQLNDEPFYPGTERRVGFVFLSPEGAETMRRAGHFYLWEGRFIGEATVVE